MALFLQYGVPTIVSAVIAITVALIARKTARGAKATEDAKATTEANVASFAANLELNEYIDKRVEALVKPVRDELAQTKANESVRTAAMTRILRAIANQWPAGSAPHLDPADIKAIEETIPSQWLAPLKEIP